MASNKNEVIVEGNLVKDPEMRTTLSGSLVCNFSIASNRFHKNGDEFEKETTFLDIQCWNNTAYDVNMNIRKGDLVEIKGCLKQQRWTDKSGQNRSKIIIVTNSVYKQKRYAKSQMQTQAEECPF